jgi:hypothetical protein
MSLFTCHLCGVECRNLSRHITVDCSATKKDMFGLAGCVTPAMIRSSSRPVHTKKRANCSDESTEDQSVKKQRKLAFDQTPVTATCRAAIELEHNDLHQLEEKHNESFSSMGSDDDVRLAAAEGIGGRMFPPEECVPLCFEAAAEERELEGPSVEAAVEERCTAAFNKIGLSNALDFDFVKTVIDHNLSQSAADGILKLVHEAIASVESRIQAAAMPTKMKKYYDRMDSAMAVNSATDTGIQMRTARVKLPDLRCFQDNDLTHVNFTYIEPRHFIENLSSLYTFVDLILPRVPDKFDGSSINDLHTSKRVWKVTKRARKRLGISDLHVLGVIPYADATPANNGRISLTPWSYIFSILKRSLRDKDLARNLAGYEPEFHDLEFVGSHESYKAFNRIMTHVTDNFFISQFTKLKNEVFELKFKKTPFADLSNSETVTVKFIVEPLMYMADYPEMMRKANLKETVNSTAACPRCLVPHSALYNTQIRGHPERDFAEENVMRKNVSTCFVPHK